MWVPEVTVLQDRAGDTEEARRLETASGRAGRTRRLQGCGQAKPAWAGRGGRSRGARGRHPSRGRGVWLEPVCIGLTGCAWLRAWAGPESGVSTAVAKPAQSPASCCPAPPCVAAPGDGRPGQGRGRQAGGGEAGVSHAGRANAVGILLLTLLFQAGM